MEEYPKIDASTSIDRVCVLCNENDERPLAKLTQKGCNSLAARSKAKDDGLDIRPNQYVHEDCRKNYCYDYNKKRKLHESTKDKIRSPKTRKLAGSRFLYENSCILCGSNIEKLQNDNDVVHRVETFDFQQSIKTLCAARNDEWASEILGRIEGVNDLPAAEARYHQSCNSNFRTLKSIPERYRSVSESSRKVRGRPSNLASMKSFLDTMQYFESHEKEQLSVVDLVNIMSEKCGEHSYSSLYMKKKILEYFGDNIIIAEVNGKQDVVTFKSEAHSILHAFYKRSKSNECQSEKDAIITTAARFILNDIKSIEKCKDMYPQASQITALDSNLEYLPDSLQLLLQKIIDNKQGKKKIASIGQSIVQTATPRSLLCPLQLGLGVMVHHMSGSKMLVDCLNSLGFSVSYQEVGIYERNAAVAHGINIDTMSNEFVQFVADNVDHNICTIDGLHTFHGMGIIAAVTPKLNRTQVIPRINVTHDDVIQTAKIDIKFYKQPNCFMEEMKFKHLNDVSHEREFEELEFILKIARPLKAELPGWSGTMQMIRQGKHHGEASVVFMPMIDMSASDLSCIYSTLHFVTKQSRSYGSTPVLTFDQPLYWKAFNIIKNESDNSVIKSIVLRLGGFHSEMSYLGCIGHLMQNSGLKELLSTVYAETSVVHMLNGKAISRAIRGHFLVDDALNTLLLEKLINTEDTSHNATEIGHFDKVEIAKASEIIHEIKNEKCIPASVNDCEVKTMISKLDSFKDHLTEFRTAKLWIDTYMDMLSHLKSFITAERTGNWGLHLKSLQRMLPYFAAAGHNNYLKSAYVYIQEMLDLPCTKPDIYLAFSSGLHVLRRTDRYWAGLSTDLVIEQVLMRSLKSAGGLTRGRGMTESQRAQWLLSAPAMAEVNFAMQEFTGVSTSNENSQHKEASKSRLERDTQDRDCFVDFLRQRNPFTEEKTLRNIETGVTGNDSVTVDIAKDIGKKIISKIEGQRVTSYSFKRKDEAVTLAARNTLKPSEIELCFADPQVLFQRLIAISDSTLDNTEEMFRYELSGTPPSLFDSGGLLMEAEKPNLASAIWELGSCGSNEEIGENVNYVLDGGSLIQRIPWKSGISFDKICEKYADYVETHYGKAHVIFDGYNDGPSTKDVTHLRRSKGIEGVEIKFDGTTPFTTKKDSVLINTKNKQRFIDLLSTHLEKRNINVKNAVGDADVLIAKTAAYVSLVSTTVVIGEDTDLLVLLCYQPTTENKIYLKSDKISNHKKMWDINATKTILTSETCKHLLFVHALSGCDTTSRLFGIGKGTVLKKLAADKYFQDQSSVFLKENASHEEIARAGEKALICVYTNNGRNIDTLDILRYEKFITKTAKSKNIVQVRSLPPTSAAAKYHSYRVYHQIQAWIGNDLDPLDWGWIQNENRLIPLKTDLPAAPERLINIIKCNCKNCDTKRCSCRRHGLPCSSACGGCRGTGCSNSSSLENTNDEIE